jgi:hypothetical protein
MLGLPLDCRHLLMTVKRNVQDTALAAGQGHNDKPPGVSDICRPNLRGD